MESLNVDILVASQLLEYNPQVSLSCETGNQSFLYGMSHLSMAYVHSFNTGTD